MKAVLLMDLANVTVPLTQLHRTLDPLLTVRNLRKLPEMERVSGLWAFADYQQAHFSQSLQRDLMAAGFQLVQAPRLTTGNENGKSTDDMELASHADWLLDNCGTFDTVLLASGDRDFLRVSQRFLNRGLKVILVDPDLLSASRDLRNAVDDEVSIIAWKENPAQGYRPIVSGGESEADGAGRPAEDSEAHADIRSICKRLFEGRDGAASQSDLDLLRQSVASGYGDDQSANLLIAAYRAHLYVMRIVEYHAERERPCTMRHLLNVVRGDPGPQYYDLEPVEGLTEDDYRVIIGSMVRSGFLEVTHPEDNGKKYSNFIRGSRAPLGLE